MFFFIFPYIGNGIIPTDELIFFRGVGSTTNQIRFTKCMQALLDVMLNQAQVKMGVPNNDGQSLKPSLYTKKTNQPSI